VGRTLLLFFLLFVVVLVLLFMSFFLGFLVGRLSFFMLAPGPLCHFGSLCFCVFRFNDTALLKFTAVLLHLLFVVLMRIGHVFTGLAEVVEFLAGLFQNFPHFLGGPLKHLSVFLMLAMFTVFVLVVTAGMLFFFAVVVVVVVTVVVTGLTLFAALGREVFKGSLHDAAGVIVSDFFVPEKLTEDSF
jgi:hypothetical protein